MSGDGAASGGLPPPGSEGDAHFTVSVGWCGGHGEAVLDENQHVRTVNGLPVFVDDDGWRMILERIDLSGAWRGSPVVRVSGRIRLKRRKGRNVSVPGAPKERYLELLVISLVDARIVGERAEEK